MAWWETVLGILAGIAGLYTALLLGLWVYATRNPQTVGMRDALRLLPDLLRVIRRLVADRAVPRRARIALALLLAYLLSPVDLVPDFIPVLGYADDVVVVALVLRHLIRSAGPAPLRRHWPGTPAGLSVVERLAGIGPVAPERGDGHDA